MSEVAKSLRDRRLNVWNEARQLPMTAADENRQMTPEEDGKFQRMMEELDKIDEKLGGVLAAEKRSKDTDDAFNAITRKPENRSSAYRGVYNADSDGRDVNTEIRSWIRGETNNRAIEYGHNGPFGSQELRTLISTASGASGIVPTDFYDRLIAHLIEVSGIMQAGPTLLNTDRRGNAADPPDHHPRDRVADRSGCPDPRRRPRVRADRPVVIQVRRHDPGGP